MLQGMKIPTQLLPDPALEQSSEMTFGVDDQAITLDIVVLQPSACCPVCGRETTHRHSRYARSLADLPWADHSVRIALHVRRFYCDNPGCVRQIFCERVATLAAPWARRTQRLAATQVQLGLWAGGSGGAQLALTLHMPAGHDLLLTLVRQLPQPDTPTPRVLGVDDWALRKGSTYGTILVDLERGCIVDLLPDRTPETLAAWLCVHPGVEIVSRDRAEAYAEGIRQGAPNALQVADRWHLLSNLAEAVHRILQQHHTAVERALTQAAPAAAQAPTGTGAEAAQSAATPATIASQPPPSPADLRRQQRIETVQKLQQHGQTQRAIAHQLGLSTKTVRRYLHTPLPLLPLRRTHHTLLEPYKAYLIERWNDGCHNAAQLCREIRARGYAGQVTIVRSCTAQLRQASGLPPRTRSATAAPLTADPTRRPPTLRRLTGLVLRQPARLNETEQAYLSRISGADAQLQLAVQLAREFTAIVRQRQVAKLDHWLAAAEASGLAKLANLAASLRRDEAAVRAAVSLSWSNGPTEGHINRLKCRKRQMYGRAHLDLLSQRLRAT
jgi:transposase